ncbi:unnamed protein product [Notodromas monacha]|uniref:Uncharacterized protein n=1 Tax=Notodromas monacha TaxID=399045 RepID=A0A7R9BHR5_9CRUS|nr:unnamed protein product [Notodromas monacha]CAG0915724.1 unnamed protein product [Notodromas monacha]
MSDSEKVVEPFDVAESNESYSEAQGEKEMESDLPILIEDSDEEGEAMEEKEISEKRENLDDASLQRIGDFLPFLENEKNAQIGRDGLKAELDHLQKESQQYAEHISSQKRILQKYVLEEKEISEKRENLEECGEVIAELHEREESQLLQVEASMRRQMERHSAVFQSALSGIPQEKEISEKRENLEECGEVIAELHEREESQLLQVEASMRRQMERHSAVFQSALSGIPQLKTPENLAAAKRPRTNEESGIVEDSQALDALSKRVKTKGSVPLQVASASVKREVKQGAFGFDMEEELLDLLNPWHCYHPFRGSLFEPEDPIGYKRNVFKRFGLDLQKLDKDSKHFLPVPGCVVQDYTYGSPQNRHQGAKLKNSGKGPCVLLLGTSLTVPWRLAEGRNTFCDNIRPEKATTRAYSLSGWSALVGEGQVVSPEEMRNRVYADLHLSSSFRFTHVFVRVGTNDLKNLTEPDVICHYPNFGHFLQALYGYFDELSRAFDAPVLALGASAPPALAQGSNTYLMEKMDLDLQGVPLIPLRNNGVPILSQRGRESAGHAFQMALYNGLKTKIGKRQGALSGKGWWAVPTPVRHLAAFDRSDRTKLSFGHIHTRAYLFFAQLHAAAICFGLEWTQCLNKTWGAFACAGSCPYWLSVPTPVRHLAAFDRSDRTKLSFGHIHTRAYLFFAQLHAAAICFGLEWTQCLNKTWGAFACAGSCLYWLDSGKTAPGIPPGLPHHHSTDHGPKECFGNGPFHINPAVIGSGGDPFRQMDEILSQKMFLEVFSADFLCSDPKRAVSGRFVVGSSSRVGNSSQRKFIISKVGDKAWVVGEGGLEFAEMASLSRYV